MENTKYKFVNFEKFLDIFRSYSNDPSQMVPLTEVLLNCFLDNEETDLILSKLIIPNNGLLTIEGETVTDKVLLDELKSRLLIDISTTTNDK